MNGSVILLATQRTGTNALRNVLHSHPEISANIGEIFRDGAGVETSETGFFSYVRNQARLDTKWALPVHRERLFLDFLDQVCSITRRRVTIFDVKYNSTHHLDGLWRRPDEPPAMFHMLVRNRIPVIHLVRDNLLDLVVSEIRADALQQYRRNLGEQIDRQALVLDSNDVLWRLREREQSVSFVRQALAEHPALFELTYEQLTSPSSTHCTSPTGPLNAKCLERLAKFLGVRPLFDPHPSIQKLSSGDLRRDVANFAEIRASLIGTPYERFLS